MLGSLKCVCLKERERKIKLKKYAIVSMSIRIGYRYGLYYVVYMLPRLEWWN